MLKYWLVHAINFFIPDMDPFEALGGPKREDGGIIIPDIASILGFGSDWLFNSQNENDRKE